MNMPKVNAYQLIKLSIWLILLTCILTCLIIFVGGPKFLDSTINKTGESVYGTRIMRVRTSQYFKDLFNEESAIIMQEKSSNNWYKSTIGCDLFIKATQKNTTKVTCNAILADKEQSAILVNPNLFFEVRGRFQEINDRYSSKGYKIEKKFVLLSIETVRLYEDCSTYFVSEIPEYCFV